MTLNRHKKCKSSVNTKAVKHTTCKAQIKNNRLGECLVLIIMLLTFSAISCSSDNNSADTSSKSKPIAPITKKESIPIDEKKLLSNSFFGDFSHAEKVSNSGETTLEVWKPYIDYCATLSKMFRSAMCSGSKKLSVTYDQVWIIVDPIDEDTTTLYWKDSKVQACTIEKIYEGNPYTKEGLPQPMHKTTNIYDRDYILKHHKD